MWVDNEEHNIHEREGSAGVSRWDYLGETGNYSEKARWCLEGRTSPT